MPLTTFARTLVSATFAMAALAGAAQATVLTTFDLTAIDGTSWSSINSTPVRVDFGTGYGLGTISVASLNGGFFQSYQTPYTGENYSGLDLGGGNRLNVTNESVFVLGHGSSSPADALAGVSFTVKLDAGSFAAGTVVDIRSLDWTGNNIHQYFSPGDAFASPYGAALPTDFNSASAVPLTLIGTDADGDLYGASTPGVSQGAAFPLAFATDEFSFRLLTTASYGGGVAFSIALPPAQVPEPETISLMLLGLGLVGVSVRRRSRAAA